MIRQLLPRKRHKILNPHSNKFSLMSIGRDVVQRGFMLGLKKDHTKPYLLGFVAFIKSR